MVTNNLIWSNEDQCYITIPDGDVATHKQIKEYYEQFKDYEKHIPRID